MVCGLCGLVWLLFFVFDECEDLEWSLSNFVEWFIFVVMLVYGEWWLIISNWLLYGLCDGSG